MEAIGVVSMIGNIYKNETAMDNIFHVSVMCYFTLTNITFQVLIISKNVMSSFIRILKQLQDAYI